MTATAFDHTVAGLARRQHGVFAHHQVLAAGGTRRMVANRLASRRWIALDHHVYALPSHPASWLRQAKAAELRFEHGAVSGRAAVVLHGLGGLRPGGIELTVPRPFGRGPCRLAKVRQRNDIPVTVVQGIRVVTAAWALGDLAGVADVAALERAVDDALVRGQVATEDLVRAHDGMVARRARGVRRFGSVLDERLDGYVPPTNELEACLYALLDRADVPPYQRQAPFPWRPGAPQRVDAFIPSWSRIVEADGRLWHARHTDFERDKRRDHEAQRRGIEVTRFTFRQIVHEPEYALDVLAGIGRARLAA